MYICLRVSLTVWARSKNSPTSLTQQVLPLRYLTRLQASQLKSLEPSDYNDQDMFEVSPNNITFHGHVSPHDSCYDMATREQF